MQLTHILTLAFAITATTTAQRYHPHGDQYQRRQVVGSTASFTQYGPCNDPSQVSCAWYSASGYNAAISQAAYGGSPGSGPSAACGVCWQLTPDYPGANEIVVKVNNLCPDDGNPLCAAPEGELCFAVLALSPFFFSFFSFFFPLFLFSSPLPDLHPKRYLLNHSVRFC